MNELCTKYYVYVLFHDAEKTIGKGCGKRYKHHEFEGKRPGYIEKHNIVKYRSVLKAVKTFGFVPYDLVQINLTEDAAFALEVELIQTWGRLCDNSGYLTNLTLGGEGGLGLMPRTVTAKSRARMSASAKARVREPISAETRAKMKAALIGRIFTPEHCAAISVAKKGTVVSDETRATLSAAQKARHQRESFSAETLEKLRAIHIGRKRSPEARANMREGRKRARLLREQSASMVVEIGAQGA